MNILILSLTCETIAIATKVKKGESNIKVFVSFLIKKVKKLSRKKINNNKFTDLFRLKDLMIICKLNSNKNKHNTNKIYVKF